WRRGLLPIGLHRGREFRSSTRAPAPATLALRRDPALAPAPTPAGAVPAGSCHRQSPVAHGPSVRSAPGRVLVAAVAHAAIVHSASRDKLPAYKCRAT